MAYFTKPPCYAVNGDCPDRDTNCHAVCQRYKDWEIIHDQERQKRYNIYCKDRDLDTFEIQQGLRIKRLNRARAEAEKRRR